MLNLGTAAEKLEADLWEAAGTSRASGPEYLPCLLCGLACDVLERLTHGKDTQTIVLYATVAVFPRVR